MNMDLGQIVDFRDFGAFWVAVGAFAVADALVVWGLARNKGWRERR
jgi:hypothetical protein